MTQPFLALITPLAGAPGVPTHPIAPGGPPPGYWGGVAPPLPTHPIAPGGPPPGYWGGIAPPYPDQGLPGSQPIPSHPIVIPPDGLAPGVPTHPIVIPSPPIHPSHPIVIPPDSIEPGVPSQPIYIPPGIWGPTDPRPTPPIHLPEPPVPGEGDKALVLVIAPGHQPTWFLIDANDGLKPTHPQPK
jgi:hypothetical protein